MINLGYLKLLINFDASAEKRKHYRDNNIMMRQSLISYPVFLVKFWNLNSFQFVWSFSALKIQRRIYSHAEPYSNTTNFYSLKKLKTTLLQNWIGVCFDMQSSLGEIISLFLLLKVSFPDGWTSFVFWLGYTNSSINPFIYAVKFKEFRPAFRDSLSWLVCRSSGRHRSEAPRWTSTNTNINFKVSKKNIFWRNTKYFQFTLTPSCADVIKHLMVILSANCKIFSCTK